VFWQLKLYRHLTKPDLVNALRAELAAWLAEPRQQFGKID